ncbi:hypothetical protein ACFODZ_11625 [Marinicella sediminis]|uniref:Uncharacterized protein n=1 Tax=Marinicella sediminis TaxID=1792834 RepID=A0ABV7JDE6_9GAMM|nr:hypothetical protein [Marinicella sediminis]
MSHSLGNNLFNEMKNWGFIDHNGQFKKGLLMNDQGKRLLIKQIFPKKSPGLIDVYFQYAHVVTVNGYHKSDPAVVLGFDLKNQAIYPVLYRNDLLDHTISVYQQGTQDEDKAEWLLKFCTDWFGELNADDYDHLEQAHLKAG